MSLKEFSFDIGNCPGALVDIAERLGAEHVNIEGIAGLTVLEEGVVGMITSETGTTRKLLRELGIDFEEREGLVLEVPNHPGELAHVLQRLSEDRINVLSVYAGVEKNQLIITVDQTDGAKRILHLE